MHPRAAFRTRSFGALPHAAACLALAAGSAASAGPDPKFGPQVREHRAQVSFTTIDQSMWASGAGFQYEFAQDFTRSWSTGSLVVNPPAVSGGGVTVDTNFAVSGTGRLGVGLGFGLESGLATAALDYDLALRAPVVATVGEFFRIEGAAELLPSSVLLTTSPSAHAYLDGILAASTNLWAEAKVSCSDITALLGGIQRGTFVKRWYPLVAIDERETLFGFNGDGRGRLIWKGKDLGGVGSVIKVGNPLAPSAEITVGDWRIDAMGGASGGRIVAEGATTLLSTLIDIDASLTGGSPLTGAGVDAGMSDNVRLRTGYDVIDFDTGYDIGYQQRFELDAAPLVTLTFSQPVDVRLPGGAVISTMEIGPAPIDELPEISLAAGTVTVIPTYHVQAQLRNDTDLLLDLDFDSKVAHGWFEFRFNSSVYSKTVNRSFGPLWSRHDPVVSGVVDVYDQSFPLLGFESQVGQPFVIRAR